MIKTPWSLFRERRTPAARSEAAAAWKDLCSEKEERHPSAYTTGDYTEIVTRLGDVKEAYGRLVAAGDPSEKFHALMGTAIDTLGGASKSSRQADESKAVQEARDMTETALFLLVKEGILSSERKKEGGDPLAMLVRELYDRLEALSPTTRQR